MPIGMQTARLEVQTPTMTLMGAFTEYESNIKETLQREMERIVTDGTLARSALSELEKQLPKFVEEQVRSALYGLEFSTFLRPILKAALTSLIEGKK